jgi:nicotinamidase-related amidase
MKTGRPGEARTPRWTPEGRAPLLPTPPAEQRTRKTHNKTERDDVLMPGDCALLLLDHQALQFAGLRSHDTGWVMDNAVGLARAAKALGVPTLFSTGLAPRVGHLLEPLQAVFPNQRPIDRVTLSAWTDPRVAAWVEETGRRKLIMAGLWTDACLALSAVDALGEGYQVFIVTGASGSVSLEAHEMGIQQMVEAGAVPITSRAIAGVRPSEPRAGWTCEDQDLLEDIAYPAKAANNDCESKIEFPVNTFQYRADGKLARATADPNDLRIDLHIHLAGNSSRSEYDAIFASLADHLYGR